MGSGLCQGVSYRPTFGGTSDHDFVGPKQRIERRFEQRFRDAARQIGRTQPSISLRLQELETALGERLLERDGRKIRVTTAGGRLLSYADRLLELTGELEGIE